MQFERWTVIDSSHTYKWLCRCECGVERVVQKSFLKRGRSKSCGCLMRELAPSHRLVHGHNRKGKPTRTHRSWSEMVARCSNPKSKIYPYYGGRGITACERWLKFENFLADMGERPENTSLDRINNNGNYEPGNCRWATRKEQARNKRSNRMIPLNGSLVCQVEAAEHLGISQHSLSTRLLRGWSVERALEAPIRKITKAPYQSAMKGVSWDARRNKWVVSIRANGKQFKFGRFATVEEAEKVCSAQMAELFGAPSQKAAA